VIELFKKLVGAGPLPHSETRADES
jgi:hypothetical protein